MYSSAITTTMTKGTKNELIDFGKQFGVFIDKSVDTGAIPEHLSDQAIREKIRDEYLRESTVTVILAGIETKGRKHIDWELYSSMFDGTRNKKSGILVVNLPSVQCPNYVAEYGEEEKRLIYPDNNSWTSIESRAEQERRFPHLPERIIDSLIAPKGANFNRSVGQDNVGDAQVSYRCYVRGEERMRVRFGETAEAKECLVGSGGSNRTGRKVVPQGEVEW